MSGSESQGHSARVAELLQRDAYLASHLRECDVVMKGGITSGVLYPLAVCELATRYRLRNVGGTSAGAIAAAAAAAAEHGRTSDQPGSGFEGLAGLPDWLGTDNHLIGLFRPPRATRRQHALLVRAVTPGTGPLRLVLPVVGSGLGSTRWWMPVLGTLPGAFLVLALLVGDAASPLAWAGVLLALLLAVLGLVVGAVVAVLLTAGEALEQNNYGIVAGSQAYDGEDSLSDWLADEIDTLAGRSSDGPLTFGDLRRGNPGSGAPDDDPVGNLEMMTTNVTEGRPYRLPHDLGSGFHFDEQEFRLLFPDRVVEHLVRTSPGPRTAEGLLPLPPADDLPVVVAARMSLSFPLLISAVPLWTVDRSKLTCREETYERAWFSDGGIASNFPISFFDSLLPSRPTFGINLRPFHLCHPLSDNERENVWMPRSNVGGILEWWSDWSAAKGLRGVSKFLVAIARTMQNWVDNTQTRVPGYRDRIVHISHTDEEGGMNLAMPPEVLTRLTERGRCAGERLWTYYNTPLGQPLPVPELEALDAAESRPRVVSWENHRWVRLRTSLALVADAIESMSDGFDDDYTGDLIGAIDDAPGYRFKNREQQALARAVVFGASAPTSAADPTPRVRLSAGLRQLAEEVRTVEAGGPNVPLGVGAPSPAPVLRIAPGGRQAMGPTTSEGDEGSDD
jgi:predicted acylesterase/phospholipase RssA